MDQCEPVPVRHLPDELKALRQWVVWRAELRPGKSKPAKAPYQPRTGHRARTDVPVTWGTYPQALARYRQGGWHGLGFVFTAGDPYCGVDVDDCRVPLTGEITPWAWEIVETLHSYTEVSPSGPGLHVLVRASLPGDAGRKQGAVEVYDAGRYFAVTGKRLAELPSIIEARQAQVEACTRPSRWRNPPPCRWPHTQELHWPAPTPKCWRGRWPPPMARSFRRSGPASLLPIVTPTQARSIRAGRTLRSAGCWPTGPITTPSKWIVSFASRRSTARSGISRLVAAIAMAR
ncbi:MAG TPA: hypothetical protein VF099_14340 [Ktedonobacterales bacterium]